MPDPAIDPASGLIWSSPRASRRLARVVVTGFWGVVAVLVCARVALFEDIVAVRHVAAGIAGEVIRVAALLP